jgi:hypothetical protein
MQRLLIYAFRLREQYKETRQYVRSACARSVCWQTMLVNEKTFQAALTSDKEQTRCSTRITSNIADQSSSSCLDTAIGIGTAAVHAGC